MQLTRTLMPSFSRWQVEVKLNAIKFLAIAAVANMIFHAYHLRKSQTALNAGYFTGLCITDDVLQNGIIADNVKGTRMLSRDVQGNLQESSRILEEINELVNGRKGEARGLKREVTNLKGQVEDLKETRKGIEAATAQLKRIGGHVEQSVKNLAQRAHALKLEIATLEKLKEESNA